MPVDTLRATGHSREILRHAFLHKPANTLIHVPEAFSPVSRYHFPRARSMGREAMGAFHNTQPRKPAQRKRPAYRGKAKAAQQKCLRVSSSGNKEGNGAK